VVLLYSTLSRRARSRTQHITESVSLIEWPEFGLYGHRRAASIQRL